MEIDLIGGSYENNYRDWNTQRTINWYPKITGEQEKNKTKVALIPRPGLTEYVEIAGDNVRGLFTARTLTQERCFAVVDTSLYEIFYDSSTALVGALTGFSTGSRSKVYMALNSNGELMIQDPLAGYIYNITTNALTQITDIDYPRGTTLDYADGYFVISDSRGRVSFSELLAGTDWRGDSFFTPTFKPDKVKAVVAFREEIYCFGDETIEVYINDGTTPFIRQQRTSIYYGLAARDSIATWHGGVFFLGKGRTGGSEVYMMGNDYSLKPISSPDIAQFINKYFNEDAEGFVNISTEGHIFYHLHLPARETTIVYDATTGFWHERQSQRPAIDADGSRHQDMYRGRFHTYFKGMNLFSDWYSGRVFIEKGKTDDGNIRVLERTSSVFHAELKNISIYGIELDMNSGFGTTTGQGVDPLLMFKYSLDGGNTFESEEFIKLGPLGEYDYRVKINNLGTARNWALNLKITDPVDIILMQAVANIVVGSN